MERFYDRDLFGGENLPKSHGEPTFDFTALCVMKVKEAIDLLNITEQQALRTALQQQQFGNQKSIAELYNACLDLAADDPNWGERELMERVYPQRQFNDYIGYLRSRTTVLVRCIEKFISLREFEQDELLQNICLLRGIQQRNWKTGYFKTYKNLLQSLEKSPLQTFEQHAAILQIEDVHLHSPLATAHHDLAAPLFQRPIDALDRAYALKKLSLACKAMSQDRSRQTLHTLAMMAPLLDWVATLEEEAVPLMHLYAGLYHIVAETGDESASHYFTCKRHLRAFWDVLRQDRLAELQDVFTYLINYCVRCINLGQSIFKQELVELYDWLLPAGILEQQGKLSQGNFRNAFVILSLAENQAALDRLMNDYAPRVGGETALATVQLCRGYDAYRRKDYERSRTAFQRAITHLPLHKDPRLEAEALAMLMLTAGDENDLFELRELCKRLEKLLRNHRLPKAVMLPFKNFHTWVVKLLKADRQKATMSPETIQELQDALQKPHEKIFAQIWLQQWANAIRGSQK